VSGAPPVHPGGRQSCQTIKSSLWVAARWVGRQSMSSVPVIRRRWTGLVGGVLAHHLGAEVSNDGRQVGWVTTASNRAGVNVTLAGS
jgi:hypothetical protein